MISTGEISDIRNSTRHIKIDPIKLPVQILVLGAYFSHDR